MVITPYMKQVIYDLACEFGFGYYSEGPDKIDYKFWEDIPSEEIAYALAEKMEQLQNNK